MQRLDAWARMTLGRAVTRSCYPGRPGERRTHKSFLSISNRDRAELQTPLTSSTPPNLVQFGQL
jgi:hypothetical protein